MSAPLLQIEDVHATVAGKPILHGLSLTVNAGEVHAVMGPNGSGKSTLVNLIAGREGYELTAGRILLDGEPLTDLEPEERALRGVFLAFQYPVEIPGVSNLEFLKVALEQHCEYRGEPPLQAGAFIKAARERARQLDLPAEFLKRGVNEGFSGGEKKRNEILQMLMLQPRLALLDETDSGLDIDALKVVAAGVNALRGPERAIVAVTHYQRLLDHVVPDQVHVLAGGRIVRSGGKELALELEARGYAWIDGVDGDAA